MRLTLPYNTTTTTTTTTSNNNNNNSDDDVDKDNNNRDDDDGDDDNDTRDIHQYNLCIYLFILRVNCYCHGSRNRLSGRIPRQQ